MKEVLIIFFSSWKFAAVFPIAIYAFDMSFFETILYTNIGGIVGLVFFTFTSKGLIKIYDALLPAIFKNRIKPKRIFTKRRRRIIKLKAKYGFPGIVLLTHVVLSIPIGVFLTTKYFGNKKYSYLYMVLGQVTWSFIYTIFYTEVKTLIPT